MLRMCTLFQSTCSNSRKSCVKQGWRDSSKDIFARLPRTVAQAHPSHQGSPIIHLPMHPHLILGWPCDNRLLLCLCSSVLPAAVHGTRAIETPFLTFPY